MSPEYRQIVMRANRMLGPALVEHNLVKVEDLDQANDRLLDLISTGQPRQASVLAILAYDLKVVNEDDVLQHLVDTESVGLIDLRSYEIHEDFRKNVDINACWSTWSLPFDKEEDFVFIATAYYLSPAVRTYWEKQLGGSSIIWYGSSMDILADLLERIEAERGSK